MPKGSKEGVCPYCGAAPCNQRWHRGLVDVGGLELRRTCRDFGGEEGTNGEGYDSRRFHLRGHDQEELCIGCRVALDEWFKAGSDAK